MDPRFRELFALAFERVDAAHANSEIDRVRQEQDGESYEIVLRVDEEFVAAVNRVAPKLIYYLQTVQKRHPGYQGVFLSIFCDEELYFVQAAAAVAFFAQTAGLSSQELASRYNAQSAALPPLLP